MGAKRGGTAHNARLRHQSRLCGSCSMRWPLATFIRWEGELLCSTCAGLRLAFYVTERKAS